MDSISPTESVALGVLELGDDDTLIVKMPPLDPDPQKAQDFLARLTQTLQMTFTSKVRNRVLVIPHDMDVTKMVPQPRLKVEFVKTAPAAYVPAKKQDGDAAYDLHFIGEANVDQQSPGTYSRWLKPGERAALDTGIAVAIPHGYYGRIAPRSGLALKNGLDVLGGVIDSSYRGPLKVILINLASGDESQSVRVDPGDRIAQLIIERCHDVDFVEVDQLPPSERGTGGFGSTGR